MASITPAPWQVTAPSLPCAGSENIRTLGHIGFAPRLNPEDFRAPFTAAEGWGTYAQTINSGKMEAGIEVKTGRLRLSTMSLAMDPAPAAPPRRRPSTAPPPPSPAS